MTCSTEQSGNILPTTAFGRIRGANAASRPTNVEEKFATRRVVKPILISTYSQTKECLELQSQPSVRLSVSTARCLTAYGSMAAVRHIADRCPALPVR